MIGWILLAVYVLGIPLWMWIEKKFFPFKEGEYTIDFDCIQEITPEMWKNNVIARSVIWPLCVTVGIVLFPFWLLDKIFDLL